MKLSKSMILSPGRAAVGDGGAPASSSSSLSRRHRANGSTKGGSQGSPFFSAAGKKRGSSLENPEPSSPKVTCIGQVRVKTKKKVKKQQNRSLSRRRSSGDASFRRIEQGKGCGEDRRYSSAAVGVGCVPPPECPPHRSQRWVHIPGSVCEALLAFGAEFTCLFPCKSSCSSTERTAENHRGCGSVFSRWQVSLNDEGEEGRRREIEVVVGGGEQAVRSSRRHVFEDLEVKDGMIQVKGECLVGEDEEEGGRVSICIPPRNALLLMRCRSNPMRMAGLMNRLNWDEPRNQNEEIEEEEEQEMQCDEEEGDQEAKLDMEVEVEEEVESNMSSFEALLLQGNTENYQDKEAVENNGSNHEGQEEQAESREKSTVVDDEEEDQIPDAESVMEKEESKKERGLPECLLLMMCEPKLSMEVSKETWVCSTDFIRWLPERPKKPAKTSKDDGCCHEQVKRRFSLESKPKPISNAAAPLPEKNYPTKPSQQPTRSSCSLPAAVAAASMANMIEQKLVNGGGVGYEPLVLTRCKSEPTRTAAAKLIPAESCHRKNSMRKLEPHRQAATLGAAGVGF